MKHSIKAIFIFLFCVTAGCNWLRPEQAVSPENSHFIQTSKVVNAGRLKKGGNLLIVPPKAGADIEATDELDKVALMIVKGMAEVLKENKSNIKVLVADNAHEADLIVAGYVTRMGKSSKFKRWLFGNNEIGLGVSLRMSERKSGGTVIVFADSRVSENADQSFSDLGYLMGQDIARFILSGTR